MNAPLCGACGMREGEFVAAYWWLCSRCRAARGIPDNRAGREPVSIVAVGGRERFRSHTYARALAVCDRLNAHGARAGLHVAYETTEGRHA